MRSGEQKIKLLVLWDILQKNTDEDHALNADEIRLKLKDYGINVIRRVVAEDIAALNEYGYKPFCRNGTQFFFGFRDDGLFVAAHQKPVIIKRGNLPVELSDRPPFGSGFTNIPIAGLGVFHAQNGAVMRPRQFGTHCVPIRESEIEGAHIAKVPFIKSLAEICRQPFCKLGNQACAVIRPLIAALLLDDIFADLPIRQYRQTTCKYYKCDLPRDIQ